MGILSKCPHRGFHQHAKPLAGGDIYKEISDSAGHVVFSSQLSLEVIDLRNVNTT